jgi:hypothetical protein
MKKSDPELRDEIFARKSRVWEEVEAQSNVLKNIASGYPPDSAEFSALRTSAQALEFAMVLHFASFQDWVSAMSKPLKKARLKRVRTSK